MENVKQLEDRLISLTRRVIALEGKDAGNTASATSLQYSFRRMENELKQLQTEVRQLREQARQK